MNGTVSGREANDAAIGERRREASLRRRVDLARNGEAQARTKVVFHGLITGFICWVLDIPLVDMTGTVLHDAA